MQVTAGSHSVGVYGHRVHGAAGDELKHGRVVATMSAHVWMLSHGVPGFACCSRRGHGLAPAAARGLAGLGRLAVVPYIRSGPAYGHRGWAYVATAPPLVPPTTALTRSPQRWDASLPHFDQLANAGAPLGLATLTQPRRTKPPCHVTNAQVLTLPPLVGAAPS